MGFACVRLASVGVTFHSREERFALGTTCLLFSFAPFLSYSSGKAMENTYAKTVKEVVEHFEVDPEVGLSSSQIDEQRRRNGWNGE